METSQVQSELSYIKSVMEKSRPSIVINGWHFIMWGILSTFGILNTYLAILSGPKSDQIYIAWIIIVVFGWICSFGISYYEKKKGIIKRTKALNESLVHKVIYASNAAMIILGFVAPLTRVFSPYAICPSIAAILGIMYFMIGSIVENKMIRNLGFAWWLGSVILFVITMDKNLAVHSLLAYAVMMVFLQVIPGFILNKKFQLAKTV
ncbi:MAG: hypothetical protein K1X86_02205 [Ignavibacteria bacterium]|nr:hypothetical protein [Ignavibacteria bacterium]